MIGGKMDDLLKGALVLGALFMLADCSSCKPKKLRRKARRVFKKGKRKGTNATFKSGKRKSKRKRGKRSKARFTKRRR
jgi:hypothetical protein